MKNTSLYTINYNSSLICAMEKLNFSPLLLTVFVLNEKKQVIGTLTDGDIRRGLIKGLKLEDSLDKFYNKSFSFLIEGEDNFEKFKEFRKRKLIAVPLLNKEGNLLQIYNFEKFKSLLPIDAVIMAGGKGKRLLPLTLITPKPLLMVGGKEIISYNFDRLYQFGITNINVTVNYLADQLINYCNNYNSEIAFSFIKENEFLGTAGSLSMIKNLKNDTVLLMNSDLLTNIDFEDFYRSFIDRNADMLVASIPYEVNLPYAIFNTDDRIVNSFKEKPKYTYYANAGIYLFKKELLEIIPKKSVYNATDFMNDIIKNGKNLIHYPIRGYWLDIGKPEDFEKAQKDISHIDFN